MISSEQLTRFVQGNFNQASVVGVGLPHEQVEDFASRLNLKSTKAALAGETKFHAGADLRKETNDALAYVALAVEGAP